MGYSITIGNGVLADDGHWLRIDVESEGPLADAPSIPGDTNDQCNYRWPSYGALHEWAERAGQVPKPAP